MAGGGGGPRDSTTTIVPTMPEWAKPYWTGAAQKARKESYTPYQQYGGQRVAGFDPMEKQAFSQTQALGQAGPRPELDYAFGQTQQAGRTGGSPIDWGIGTYQKYANPYLEQVMAPGRERIMENYAEMLPTALRDVQMKSGQSGILGGRTNLEMAGVAKSISDATARNLREFETEGRYQSYDEARKAALDFDANRQAGARLQLDAASSAGQISELQQNQALQRISAMQEAGIARRDMEQSIRSMAYEDFLTKRDWNKEQLNWLTGILSGSPYAQTGSSSASTTNVPGASPISQAAGAGLAGYGAYQMYKNRG